MADGLDPLDDDLLAVGKVILLVTRGRRSGQPRQATIGFVAQSDGSLLVAAGAESTNWARNLVVEPACIVQRLDQRRRFRAERLSGPQHHAAVSALILKYGTPAERLGAGPAFRLWPEAASG
jgi:deazaflavin-dependent oxidoreductase (nitroreductase family)